MLNIQDLPWMHFRKIYLLLMIYYFCCITLNCYGRGRLILVSDITGYIQWRMMQQKWRVNEETGMLHLWNITDLMHC